MPNLKSRLMLIVLVASCALLIAITYSDGYAIHGRGISQAAPNQRPALSLNDTINELNTIYPDPVRIEDHFYAAERTVAFAKDQDAVLLSAIAIMEEKQQGTRNRIEFYKRILDDLDNDEDRAVRRITRLNLIELYVNEVSDQPEARRQLSKLIDEGHED